MEYKIQVTQEDIDGKNHICTDCPVARAIRRATGAKWISVGSNTGGVGFEDMKGIEFSLPPEVSERIHEYDMHNYMKPFEFILHV